MTTRLWAEIDNLQKALKLEEDRRSTLEQRVLTLEKIEVIQSFLKSAGKYLIWLALTAIGAFFAIKQNWSGK
jgi:hypothetical protein